MNTLLARMRRGETAPDPTAKNALNALVMCRSRLSAPRRLRMPPRDKDRRELFKTKRRNFDNEVDNGNTFPLPNVGGARGARRCRMTTGALQRPTTGRSATWISRVSSSSC